MTFWHFFFFVFFGRRVQSPKSICYLIYGITLAINFIIIIIFCLYAPEYTVRIRAMPFDQYLTANSKWMNRGEEVKNAKIRRRQMKRRQMERTVRCIYNWKKKQSKAKKNDLIELN